MLKIETKAYLNLKVFKTYSKYVGANDSVLFTERGFLNFSRQLFVPNDRVFEGIPTIFSGSFLKELLKEQRDTAEVRFKEKFGTIVAVVLRENAKTEWDREITDFSAMPVPGAVLEVPTREGTKLVSASALRYLLTFTDYSVNFAGDDAYASYFQGIVVKFPNPFKGLEGYADGSAFKELKKFKSPTLTWKKIGNVLYVFNGVVFFQELDDSKKVEFPKLPKEGWIKVNPKLLSKAFADTHEWFEPYRVRLEEGKIKVETRTDENEFKTAEVSYYGKAEAKEFYLSAEFGSYLEPFKNLPMVEVNFADEYVFLRYQKLEAVFKKAYAVVEQER